MRHRPIFQSVVVVVALLVFASMTFAQGEQPSGQKFRIGVIRRRVPGLNCRHSIPTNPLTHRIFPASG